MLHKMSILRHKVSSHPFPAPFSYSPFSYWLVHFWIIRETFFGICRRWGRKLDLVDCETRWLRGEWDHSQLKYRVPYHVSLWIQPQNPWPPCPEVSIYATFDHFCHLQPPSPHNQGLKIICIYLTFFENIGLFPFNISSSYCSFKVSINVWG
jgi:hypothetical protein